MTKYIACSEKPLKKAERRKLEQWIKDELERGQCYAERYQRQQADDARQEEDWQREAEGDEQ